METSGPDRQILFNVGLLLSEVFFRLIFDSSALVTSTSQFTGLWIDAGV